jgi:hypothetical protein
MGTNWKTGGDKPSDSASIALPGQKLAISKNPRMLTRSEIDLLRRDLKSALEVVGQDEIDDAEGLLHLHGFRREDYAILQRADPSPSFPSSITGTVHVVRKSDHLAKAYRAGSGSSWLAEFERDLKAGVFGLPSLRRPRAQDHMTPAAAICEAIRRRALLGFTYHGRLRVVAPYCYGVSTRGTEVLRAIQVRGVSSSGFGFGKLWAVSDMVDVHILDETFTPNDPHYNPNDSAMTQVHCHV